VCLTGWTGPGCERCVIHVTVDGDDQADGSSWDQPKATLNAAIAAAAADGCQVWVAEGTYYADPLDRRATIQMVTGVDLLGGFAGDETEPGQRDIGAHPTVLEGEIGDPAETLDNTDTLVTAADGALLEGFVLQHANSIDDEGAGLRVWRVSPVVRHCTFRANGGWSRGAVAVFDGRLVMDHCRFEANAGTPSLVVMGDSSAELVDVTFADNTSLNRTAGIYLQQADLSCTNCVFTGNVADADVGAIFIDGTATVTLVNNLFVGNTGVQSGAIIASHSRLVMRNCTLASNRASMDLGVFSTGGLWVGQASVVMTNCILWGNTTDSPEDTPDQEQIFYSDYRPYVRYSTIQGEAIFPGIGNQRTDPLFVNPDPGAGELDLRLGAGSPAIDAGSRRTLLSDFDDLDGDGDTDEPTPLDLARQPRVTGGEVDQGAYESP
jgi:hypothetical protein